MIVGFQFGRWNVADWLEEALVVEPADPCEGSKFDVLEGSPRSAAMNEFGFVEAVDGFGEGIVVTVSDTAD